MVSSSIWAAITHTVDWVAYKQKEFISHSPAWSGEGLFLGEKLLVYPHMAEGAVELFWPSSVRAVILKAPTPNALRVRFPT